MREIDVAVGGYPRGEQDWNQIVNHTNDAKPPARLQRRDK